MARGRPTAGRNSALIFIMPPPPGTLLVAALRRAVEPLVHAPQAVDATRVGGVRVVDDAVLEREGAHARPLARVRRRVGAGHGGVGARPLAAALPRRLAVVVVFDAAVALLLFLGEADAE